ncbi:hypothetical protein LCGC14_1843510 [marine sediment metagenome]|uniref:Uncharacterized protein n=1 Tax=marine sediment metagenome TaxID=412755 RepID=A0A0F9IS32_9ZZZZ
MDIIRLRTMTLKSSFTGGLWEGVSIRILIGRGQRFYCVFCYYKYSTITYTDDVLELLGITKEIQIPKPGADISMLKKWKKVNSLDKMSDDERIKFMSHINSNYHRKAKGKLRAMKHSKSVLAARNMKKY